jgi:hypothetical protein
LTYIFKPRVSSCIDNIKILRERYFKIEILDFFILNYTQLFCDKNKEKKSYNLIADEYAISYRIKAYADDRTSKKSKNGFNEIQRVFLFIEDHFKNIVEEIMDYSDRLTCFQNKILRFFSKKLKISYSDNINIEKKLYNFITTAFVVIAYLFSILALRLMNYLKTKM